MEHHRREKEWRKTTDSPYHIVPNWSRRDRVCYLNSYRNAIFVVGANCWTWDDVLANKMWSVQFDLDIRPEMECEILEADELKDPRDEGLVQKNTFGDDHRKDLVLLCTDANIVLQRELLARIENGEFRFDDHRKSLYDIWSGMTWALNDCTYRLTRCDGCNEGFEHTECAVLLLDWHHLDDDGDWIACKECLKEWVKHRSKVDGDVVEEAEEMEEEFHELDAEYAGAILLRREECQEQHCN